MHAGRTLGNNRQGPFLTGVPTFRKGPSQEGKGRYPVLAPAALGLAWRGAVWGAREDHLVRTGFLWSVVTVCAVALQAQVMETPIDAPTCVEGGKPGDLSVGGGGPISSVWPTYDQKEGDEKRPETKTKGEASKGMCKQRGKVRSDGLVCDAGEQAHTYVPMYVCACSVQYPSTVDRAEVQDVPAGVRAYVLYVSVNCTAPACFFLPRVPIRAGSSVPPIETGLQASSGPGSRTRRCRQSTECRVQDAECRPSRDQL